MVGSWKQLLPAGEISVTFFTRAAPHKPPALPVKPRPGDFHACSLHESWWTSPLGIEVFLSSPPINLSAEILNTKLAWQGGWHGWPYTSEVGAMSGFCNGTAGLRKPNVFWSPKFTAILAQGDQEVCIYRIFKWLGQQPDSTSSTNRLRQLSLLLTRYVPLGKLLSITEPRFFTVKWGCESLPWLLWEHFIRKFSLNYFTSHQHLFLKTKRRQHSRPTQSAICLHWFRGREN